MDSQPGGLGSSRSGAATTARSQEPLGTTSISQHDVLEVYPVSVRVKRQSRGNPQAAPDRSGTQIQGFSDNSRRRLRFAAVNASPSLISQFVLTYHLDWPIDGRACKAHLNTWLTYLRRKVPGVKYIWILEFQEENDDHRAPHFHVYLSIKPDREIWTYLAESWQRITNGSDDSLWFHGPRRGRAWGDWEMRSGSYLCKYLEKEKQKDIPEGYYNFGRFWGNSRDLVPDPQRVPLDDLDQVSQVDHETGEFYGGQSTVIRWLGRLAEKQTSGYSRFRSRAPHGSYTILQGADGLQKIIHYFNSLQKGENHECRSSQPQARKLPNPSLAASTSERPASVLPPSFDKHP